ncbi:MAG: hypothetical protein ACE5JI_11610 [Acidobacteriota bacterium]
MKSLSDIFSEISRKRVVLPVATERARRMNAIQPEEEMAIWIQAIHPIDFMGLGQVPRWMFDTEERKKLLPDEVDARNKQGIAWVSGIFSLGVVEPIYAEKADRSKGEVGLQDLMPDRDAVIIEILEYSALVPAREDGTGPFRAVPEQPGGAEGVPDGGEVRDQTVGTA